MLKNVVNFGPLISALNQRAGKGRNSLKKIERRSLISAIFFAYVHL